MPGNLANAMFRKQPAKPSFSANAHKRRPRRPPFLRVESDGVGVTSSILPIFIPERAKARRADCAPGPGVFVPFPKIEISPWIDLLVSE